MLLSKERGVSLVEMAIVAPFVILCIIGLISLGTALNEAPILTDAARHAGRLTVNELIKRGDPAKDPADPGNTGFAPSEESPVCDMFCGADEQIIRCDTNPAPSHSPADPVELPQYSAKVACQFLKQQNYSADTLSVGWQIKCPEELGTKIPVLSLRVLEEGGGFIPFRTLMGLNKMGSAAVFHLRGVCS